MHSAEVVPFLLIPRDAIWCIGQHSKKERAALDRATKRGEYRKVRSNWQGISPLKTVFIPLNK